jgi:hypothetical protein
VNTLHRPILHRERKPILNALLFAFSLWVAPALACAGDLVVGVVHDSDGYPVAGALVSLRQAGGASAGSGTTAGDGTFAVDAVAPVATVAVRCAYCMPATATRVADTPVVVIVRRFAALRDRGISAADARVLPYATAPQLAALLPFAVTTRGTISDRGLADARGTVIADGIALYRATDGVDLGTAVPPHGTATLAQTDPTHAGAYDARSAGGLFSIDTLDAAGGAARIDSGHGLDAIVRGGNVLRGAVETAGGAYASSRIAAAAALPAAGGTLDLRALAASGSGANADGVAASFALPMRGAALNAELSTTRSVDLNGPENDTLAALSLRHGGFTFGLRAQRASGIVGLGTGTQYDARAFAEAVHDDGRTRIFASLAAAQSGDAVPGSATVTGAVLPALGVTVRIAPSFSLHADSVAALLPLPLYLLAENPAGTAIDRTHLLDAGIGFDDAGRVRIDAMLFRQTTTTVGAGTTAGTGIAAIWQIAPSLSLRTWVLTSRTNAQGDGEYPGAAGGVYPTSTTDLDRNVVWITAGNVLRVDAISRGGTLEGDISLPAGSGARFVAGTRRDGPNRIFTFGLSLP